MAGSFSKRQKEQRRLEKREEKSARRLMRKQQKLNGETGDQNELEALDNQGSDEVPEMVSAPEQENNVKTER